MPHSAKKSTKPNVATMEPSRSRALARNPSGLTLPEMAPPADLVALQRMITGSRAEGASKPHVVHRGRDAASAPLQRDVIASAPNNTGLSNGLKASVEHLSGVSLDNVRVHYNSDKPIAVGARAYTQGTEIHVGPGQEDSVPHEAWHAAQQLQGRVTPNVQFNGRVPGNNDRRLEDEANLMGEKAFKMSRQEASPPDRLSRETITNAVVQRVGLEDEDEPKDKNLSTSSTTTTVQLPSTKTIEPTKSSPNSAPISSPNSAPISSPNSAPISSPNSAPISSPNSAPSVSAPLPVRRTRNVVPKDNTEKGVGKSSSPEEDWVYHVTSRAVAAAIKEDALKSAYLRTGNREPDHNGSFWRDRGRRIDSNRVGKIKHYATLAIDAGMNPAFVFAQDPKYESFPFECTGTDGDYARLNAFESEKLRSVITPAPKSLPKKGSAKGRPVLSKQEHALRAQKIALLSAFICAHTEHYLYKLADQYVNAFFGIEAMVTAQNVYFLDTRNTELLKSGLSDYLKLRDANDVVVLRVRRANVADLQQDMAEFRAVRTTQAVSGQVFEAMINVQSGEDYLNEGFRLEPSNWKPLKEYEF